MARLYGQPYDTKATSPNLGHDAGDPIIYRHMRHPIIPLTESPFPSCRERGDSPERVETRRREGAEES